MTWDDAIAQYVTSLRAARRADGTIRLHRHYLRHLASSTRRTPATLERGDARAFIARYSKHSAETMKSARGALVGFCRWAHAEGIMAADPTAGLAAVSVPAGVARPAPERVLARALDLAAERERTMLLLAAYGGLRCAEIAAVHRDDLVGRRLYVTGKGGKTRIVPVVHPDVLAAFARADGYLFPSPRGGHMTAGHVTKLLSLALEGDWTGHKLRHRFATRSHARNPDVLALGRVLGHSRPETTMRYVQLDDDALERVVRAAA